MLFSQVIVFPNALNILLLIPGPNVCRSVLSTGKRCQCIQVWPVHLNARSVSPSKPPTHAHAPKPTHASVQPPWESDNQAACLLPANFSQESRKRPMEDKVWSSLYQSFEDEPNPVEKMIDGRMSCHQAHCHQFQPYLGRFRSAEESGRSHPLRMESAYEILVSFQR